MRGKYSPTVNAAYAENQEWWHIYSREAEEFTLYDPEGYDSYGYNDKGIDRAGYHENDYMQDTYFCPVDGGSNYIYDQVICDWSFDGIKPVMRKQSWL